MTTTLINVGDRFRYERNGITREAVVTVILKTYGRVSPRWNDDADPTPAGTVLVEAALPDCFVVLALRPGAFELLETIG